MHSSRFCTHSVCAFRPQEGLFPLLPIPSHSPSPPCFLHLNYFSWKHHSQTALLFPTRLYKTTFSFLLFCFFFFFFFRVASNSGLAVKVSTRGDDSFKSTLPLSSSISLFRSFIRLLFGVVCGPGLRGECDSQGGLRSVRGQTHRPGRAISGKGLKTSSPPLLLSSSDKPLSTGISEAQPVSAPIVLIVRGRGAVCAAVRRLRVRPLPSLLTESVCASTGAHGESTVENLLIPCLPPQPHERKKEGSKCQKETYDNLIWYVWARPFFKSPQCCA